MTVLAPTRQVYVYGLCDPRQGGTGGVVSSVEGRARISAAHLGSKRTEATKVQMRESALKRYADPVERERLRSIGNGMPPVRRGEANNKAKVTEEQVREIRRLAAAGLTSGQIAPMFGLTYQNVWYIVARKIWKDLK